LTKNNIFMKAILKKELTQFFSSPYGYIVLVVFGLFANFMFVKDIFVIGVVSMQQFFSFIPWILMVFVPALAMRSISEEKRLNTIEILRSLPLSETEIVFGKYLGLMISSIVGLLLTIGLPISLSVISGEGAGSGVHWPEVIVGYIGVLMYIFMAQAIAVFFSSLTSNQVVAFLLSAVTLFFVNMIGSEFLATVLPKFVQDFLVVLSPTYHLTNFANGVLDFRSIFYFISVSSVFVFLTIIDLEKRS
jgi:ABC-2 type transport system permease protein